MGVGCSRRARAPMAAAQQPPIVVSTIPALEQDEMVRNMRVAAPSVPRSTRQYVKGNACWHGVFSTVRLPSDQTHKRMLFQANRMVHNNYPAFSYTSVVFNFNAVSTRHVDKKNVGLSIIWAGGDYEHGELYFYHDMEVQESFASFDLRRKLVLFDGHVPHGNCYWMGNDRFSIVFFTHQRWKSVSRDAEMVKALDDYGFKLPAIPPQPPTGDESDPDDGDEDPFTDEPEIAILPAPTDGI